jgi:phage terminase large subunit GpA-like protein
VENRGRSAEGDGIVNLLDEPATDAGADLGLIADVTAYATPPPRLTVSEWADEYRRLPETSAARGGRWHTKDTPYLRGVMDAILEPGVRKIAVMKAAQLGGSEALHNIVAYFIVYDPCPMLFVHPTMKVAQEWSKERLADMIRTTDALNDVVDPDSTLDFKQFAGGFLALGGANTPNTFARRAARLAIGDDVDRFPAVVGEEGDPAALLEKRTRTFLDGVSLFVSTPTLAKGRIDSLFKHSDQRRYMLSCPACGHTDWTTWSDVAHFFVAYDGNDAQTARLVCPNCEARHAEPARRRMVLAGRWQATAVSSEQGLVGFHLPAMVSTLGDVTLSRLVEQWLSARELGKESLRVFINTVLAEGWEDRGARMNPHGLMSRREDYGQDAEVPPGVAILTAGVDVQENRFELQVMGWGLAGERWVIDWRAINGDPRKPETRAALLDALERRYTHAQGPLLGIRAVCVDTGYATDDIYDFVLAYQSKGIFATKGFAGRSGEPMVGKANEKRRGRRGRPVRLYPVNVDDAKGEVVSALGVLEPGPGFIHFPLQLDTIDEEYFAQLCAEHKETRYNGAGVATHAVWVLDRDRNEALDTAVLCLAAFKILNPNVRQLLEQLDAIAKSTPPKPPSPTVPAPGGRWLPPRRGWLKG